MTVPTTSRGRSIRVLLVSPVGEHGGAEQVFLALGRHLPVLGVEPVLACMRPGPLVELARRQGLPAHAYQDHRYRQVRRVVFAIGWLTRLIRRERVELVHSNLSAHLYGSPAARLTGVPELWHIHDFPYRRNRLEQICLRLPTDFALFTTRRVAGGFPQLHRRPHGVVHPVCIEPATEPPRADGTVRRKYTIPPGPLLLTVSRLQEHKGHRYLIEAAPSVLQRHPDASFVLVGKSSGPEQERYRARLQQLVAQLGIADSVHFLGYVPEEDIHALYGEAAALVHPAVSEGFGLTLLEAMDAGLPVIASAAEGPKELIEPGVTGLLTSPGDAHELGQAIVRLLETPDLATTLGREARRYAATFSAARMTQETADIYRAILS